MALRPIPLACLLSLSLSACAAIPAPDPDNYRGPEIAPVTRSQSKLMELPPPVQSIPVAVYDFQDQTGQFKPQENVQTLSRAVTQGGAAILVKALQDAGNRRWFTVIERAGLDNLLKERQIIREMRQRYLGEQFVSPDALPPLLFAGIIFEGGIIGFDSNTLTGGIGARYLGVGGDTEYRQNTVTVYLRAVSVKTGEVLANVTTQKTLSSVGIQGGAFRFVSFDKLLEIEAGVTTNEPGMMALRQAVEKAVEAIIMEGAQSGIWAFADETAGAKLISKYRNDNQNATEVPSRFSSRAAEPAVTLASATDAEAPPTPAVVTEAQADAVASTAPAKAATRTRARRSSVLNGDRI